MIKLPVPARQFAQELYTEINDDDIFNGAAALGFYLTLAIFPAMLFLMAVIPYLPIPRVDEAIMELLRQALPASAAEMFTGVVAEVTREQRGGLLSLGFLGTMWASSSGMYAVMQQLNISYDVKEARGFVKARAIAIALSVLFVVLVLGAFSMIVLGGMIQEWLEARYNISDALLIAFAVFRWLVILGGLLLGYALIYYLAPNVRQEFVYITPGSAVGVAVLVVASLGFAWYAQNFGDYAATYGSIGAVIILMLWLYIAGLSILLGSEINALVEHHAAGGKEKGEKVPGQKEQDPAVARRAALAAPENEHPDADQAARLPIGDDEPKASDPPPSPANPGALHAAPPDTHADRSPEVHHASMSPQHDAVAPPRGPGVIGGPLALLQRLRRFDDKRPGVPGEHWFAFSAGMALMGWARRSGSQSAAVRAAAVAAAAVLLVRAASGRDGVVPLLKKLPLRRP